MSLYISIFKVFNPEKNGQRCLQVMYGRGNLNDFSTRYKKGFTL
jgi:hypothetical protein